MPAGRGFLERFRASGTPGAAAGAGVPADRVAEREVELAGIFERLEPTEASREQLLRSGRADAQRLRQAGDEQARAVRAAARRDADSERREAATRVAAQADAESAEIVARAERDAAAIRSHAAQVGPQYVARVLAAVRADLGLEPGQ